MLRGAKSTSTSSEGTTIAMEGEGDTPLCGVCEELKATKFCESCSDALCNSCAKSHAKYVGPSHVLREIAYGSRHSSISRSESVGEVAKICACGRHPSYQVSRVCKPCKIVLCEKCVEEELHKDHDVVAFQDDRDFMAEVCNNRVKSLSDNIDNVGKLSYVSNASEESIDAAILQLKHKHAEMAQTMNTCVLKNISILEKEKQRIRKDAEYVKEEAENNISKMKSRMSGLDSVCKTQDLNAMVDEITLCDHVMDDVDQFMREYRQTIPKVHRVEDLLPGLKLSDNLNKTMDQVFEVVLTGKSTQESGVEIEGGTPGVAQKNKFEYQKVEINRCVEMKECYVGKMVQGSKLQQHMNQVVMYRNGEREVYIVNYKEASLKYVKAGFNIDNCLTVSSDRHVAKEHRSQNLHLLDNNFKKVHKTKGPEDMVSMCGLGQNELLVHSVHKYYPHNTFYTYQIIKDKIKLKDSIQVTQKIRSNDVLVYSYMCLDPINDKIIVACTGYELSEICIVDLKSGSVDRFKINVGVRFTTPYVDDHGDLLMYTDDQTIRVYRNIQDGIDEFEVLNNVKVDGILRGIARHGNKLILGYRDRVECYSVQL